jgi:hypothetical protein
MHIAFSVLLLLSTDFSFGFSNDCTKLDQDADVSNGKEGKHGGEGAGSTEMVVDA